LFNPFLTFVVLLLTVYYSQHCFVYNR